MSAAAKVEPITVVLEVKRKGLRWQGAFVIGDESLIAVWAFTRRGVFRRLAREIRA